MRFDVDPDDLTVLIEACEVEIARRQRVALVAAGELARSAGDRRPGAVRIANLLGEAASLARVLRALDPSVESVETETHVIADAEIVQRVTVLPEDELDESVGS